MLKFLPSADDRQTIVLSCDQAVIAATRARYEKEHSERPSKAEIEDTPTARRLTRKWIDEQVKEARRRYVETGDASGLEIPPDGCSQVVIRPLTKAERRKASASIESLPLIDDDKAQTVGSMRERGDALTASYIETVRLGLVSIDGCEIDPDWVERLGTEAVEEIATWITNYSKVPGFFERS